MANRGQNVPPQFQDRGQPGRMGNPRGPRARDVNRVSVHKEARALEETGSWAASAAEADRGREILETARPGRRFKPRQGRGNSSAYQPSTVETPPSDDVLYDGHGSGSKPVHLQGCHNLDQASFSVVLQESYAQFIGIDQSMSRVVPFCMWQHAFVELLWATVLSRVKFENSDARLSRETDPFTLGNFAEMWVPATIADYIRSYCSTSTPAGESIALNIPDATFPRGPVVGDAEAEPPILEIAAGSFGVCDHLTHNAYETAFSPYVTRRLIERTREVDAMAPPVGGNANAPARVQYVGRYGAWNPLPAGFFPALATPTENLLGYRFPEKIRSDTLNELVRCTFQDDDSVLGRLAHCPYAVGSVSAFVHRNRGIKSSMAKDVAAVPMQATYLVTNVHEQVGVDPIYRRVGMVLSPYAFGASLSNKASYCAYKRQRSNISPGVCFTIAGDTPPGWLETRDYNYEMVEPFSPYSYYVDRPNLRQLDHSEPYPHNSANLIYRQWANRHCLVERDKRF